jgi:hypothetical protein
MMNMFVAERLGVPESVAATVTANVPASAGVPVKVRVAALKIMPAGTPDAV